jgi:uncharacterized protein YyaL (SSP411 family)
MAMANRLAGATSPYLLQHADNPVDWWEWSPEAFTEARRRNVPILLSVGYAACHWCHVMNRTLRIWRQNTKSQVRGTISVQIDSLSFAV